MELTPLEFRLLAYLMHHAGRAVHQTELTEHLYADEADRGDNAIEALVARLASSATLSLAKIKRLTAVAPSQSLEAHLAMEAEGMIASGATADAREGVTAFIEKRPPNWSGR